MFIKPLLPSRFPSLYSPTNILTLICYLSQERRGYLDKMNLQLFIIDI